MTRGKRAAGPRGEHDREGFTEMVAQAAESLVRNEGFRGLGMRRLAAAIGYAPNSIYNAVGDLDQVILRVNARTFRRLHTTLQSAIDPNRPARDNALALADAYLVFVAADPRVWSLVFEHVAAPDVPFPDWYAEALAEAVGLVDQVLTPMLPDPTERRQAVATLWAGLHGLASLSTSNKLAVLVPDSPRVLARMLVGRFLGEGPQAP
ncbi:AcrR family transcriptional regulator [Methylobacterium brachythecii]|uniref:AcrR family transcriptional regulator n=2 Tax=Methylobacterium brachythecii TaxID=1176177 RepID=A0A7W6F642_9HYPH|nr:AcrR family transcriptional regulator [Methylobacterium brachythecii]GLS43351.1 TetR family transcriptional regulator [Methylobacterium brachythecii]